jgi:hypothetical protein
MNLAIIMTAPDRKFQVNRQMSLHGPIDGGLK